MRQLAWYRRPILNFLARYSREELARLLDTSQPGTDFQGWIVRRLAHTLSAAEVFSLIHAKNLWGITETKSGAGSTIEETINIRRQLPIWFKQYGIESLLDIPCGDFNWMRQVDLSGIRYIGADIVADLVSACIAQHSAPGREFVCLNLLTDPLPKTDAVLCRDCMVHLPNADLRRALVNIAASGTRYLLATTFPALTENQEVALGYWRPVNLQRSPFSLPPPLALIHEGNPDARYVDKSLGVWRVDDFAKAL